MDAGKIQVFLERLGCEKIKLTSGWVKACCPLAPYRSAHAKGTDRRPSFAIAIDTDHHNGVVCHTCRFSGTMPSLLWALANHTSKDYTPLFKFVTEHDHQEEEELPEKISKIPESPPDYQPVEVAGISVSPLMFQTSFAHAKPEDVTLDEAILDKFKNVTPEAKAWFHKRGLHPKTVETFELGWHEERRRISVPIRDLKGRLVGISGRAMDKEMSPKFLHSKGFKRDLFLYGEHLCQTPGVGYLVEGFFDAMMLWQKGYRNAFCFMGPGLSSFQVEKVVKLCDRVVIVPDGDAAGYEIATRCEKMLLPRLSWTKVISVPEGLDPDQLSSKFLFDMLGPPQAAPLDDYIPA
jgi:hypothetical protein